MDLLSLMIAKFLPSAVKFVYNWNLRELDNVFNGLTRMNPDHYHTPLQCMRLYIHEINRTFKIEKLKFSKLCTILCTSCNYRKNYFYSFIPLLMSSL